MQNNKKIILSLLLVSAVSMLAGYAIMNPVLFGFCPTPENWQDIECERSFPTFSWGQPLFYTPIIPIFIFLILFFSPQRFFNAWKWFALIFGIFSILLIAISPAQGGGIISISKEIMSWTMSILFSAISLIIILTQAYLHSRNKKASDK